LSRPRRAELAFSYSDLETSLGGSLMLDFVGWYFPWSRLDMVLRIGLVIWLTVVAASFWIYWQTVIAGKPWLMRRRHKR
jgi:hypothetical protein